MNARVGLAVPLTTVVLALAGLGGAVSVAAAAGGGGGAGQLTKSFPLGTSTLCCKRTTITVTPRKLHTVIPRKPHTVVIVKHHSGGVSGILIAALVAVQILLIAALVAWYRRRPLAQESVSRDYRVSSRDELPTPHK